MILPFDAAAVGKLLPPRPFLRKGWKWMDMQPQNYQPLPPPGQKRLAGPKKPSWVREVKIQSLMLAMALFLTLLFLWAVDFFGYFLVWPVISSLSRMGMSEEILIELYGIGAYVLVFGLPYLLYAAAIRFRLTGIPHDPVYPPVTASATGICLGVSVLGVLCAMILNAFLMTIGLYPPDLYTPLPQNPVALLLNMISLTVLPALLEEFVSRGIVLGSLRRYGDRFAIVVSAFMFALLHRNTVQLPNAFLLGLALGYFFIKTNSIWTCVIIHFVNNLLAFLLSAAMEYMDPILAALVDYTSLLIYLALGLCGLCCLIARRVDFSLPKRMGAPGALPAARYFFLNIPMVIVLVLYGVSILLSFYSGY